VNKKKKTNGSDVTFCPIKRKAPPWGGTHSLSPTHHILSKPNTSHQPSRFHLIDFPIFSFDRGWQSAAMGEETPLTPEQTKARAEALVPKFQLERVLNQGI
jgi:hypothetical protein